MGVLTRTIVAAALTGALVSACGSGNTIMEAPVADPARIGAESIPTEDSSTVQMGEQIIRTANISMTVDNIDARLDSLTALVTDSSGFIQSQTVSSYDGNTTANVIARVPAADLDAFLESIAEFGNITNSSVDTQDVTVEVIDLEVRITTLQDSIARLRQLQQQATSVADLITVEAELANRQAELESFEARRDYLAQQVDMATVYVYMTEEGLGAPASPDFLGGLQTGWNALISLLAGLTTGIGFLLPFLVVGGIITGVVLTLVTVTRRRESARQKGEERP
ncbi:MAG: DUF4349 domain-containing protein [Candidatus Nanopelagicales bacterium]